MSKEKATQRINGGSAEKKPAKKFSPLLIVILVVFALLIVFIMFIVSRRSNSDEANRVVTPDNVEEILANLDDSENAEIGSYEVYMNNVWHFPDSASSSTDAYVENRVTNTNTVYFTIALPESEEEIYKSPYIPVGSSLDNITLDSELAAGSYKTVLTYHLVDDSFEEISYVSVYVTLVIEN